MIQNAFNREELLRRRSAAQRTAWILGTLVLGLYLAGFLIPR